MSLLREGYIIVFRILYARRYPVNAGAALRATLGALSDGEAVLAGFGSLLALGKAAAQLARQYDVPFFRLASLEQTGGLGTEGLPFMPVGVAACRSCGRVVTTTGGDFDYYTLSFRFYQG